MSRRIAHRPHYRNIHQAAPNFTNAQQPYLSQRWSYRRQQGFHERQTLAQKLSLVPVSHRLFGLLLPRLRTH